jgi:hypothetical protein
MSGTTPKPAPLFKGWVDTETRIELLGRFFAEQEGRPAWTPDPTPDPKPERARQTRTTVDARAAALRVAVLGQTPGRVVVVCPHCHGRRPISTDVLRKWATDGRVPPCGVSKGNRASCEPFESRAAA